MLTVRSALSSLFFIVVIGLDVYSLKPSDSVWWLFCITIKKSFKSFLFRNKFLILAYRKQRC